MSTGSTPETPDSMSDRTKRLIQFVRELLPDTGTKVQGAQSQETTTVGALAFISTSWSV